MKRIFCIIALVSLFGLAVLGCDKQLSTSASEMIVNNTTANKQSESEKVESDKSLEKGEGVEDNETTEYLDYSDYKNDIDDIMVVRVNDAGMNGSQASLRENEDIFCEAWTNEYKSIIDHIIKKCKKKEDKKKIKSAKKAFIAYKKKMREVAELELLDGYDRDSKTTITMLYGNGTRSRLNLFEGKLYRDACITLIKQLNEKDSYKIKFTEEMYEKLKKSK